MSLLLFWQSESSSEVTSTATFTQAAATWSAAATETIPSTGSWTQAPAAWQASASEEITASATFAQPATWQADATETIPATASFGQVAASWSGAASEEIPATATFAQSAGWDAVLDTPIQPAPSVSSGLYPRRRVHEAFPDLYWPDPPPKPVTATAAFAQSPCAVGARVAVDTEILDEEVLLALV